MKARGGLRCPWATTATKLCLQTVAKPRGSQRHIQTMNARRTFKINLPDFTWTLAKTESACLLSANISMLRVCWVTSFAQIINITNHTGLFTSSASAAFAATLVEQKALYVRGSFEVCEVYQSLPSASISITRSFQVFTLHTSSKSLLLRRLKIVQSKRVSPWSKECKDQDPQESTGIPGQNVPD